MPAAAQPACFVLTADRSKSKPFYAEMPGLRPLGEDGHGVPLDLGNGTPLRLADLPGHVGAGHTVTG